MPPKSSATALNNYNAQLKQLNRKVTDLNGLVRIVESAPSKRGIENVDEGIDKLNEFYEILDKNASIVQSSDHEKIDEIEKELTQASAQVQDAVQSAYSLLSRLRKRPPPDPLNTSTDSGSIPQTITPRINESIRPFKLKKDDAPLSMDSWKRRFKVWYNSSNMHLCPIDEQHEYFLSCLDESLGRSIGLDILPTMPIYGKDGANGCMELLTQEFDKNFPIFTRRVVFFSTGQGHTESKMDWINKLRLLGDQSEINTMTPDNMYVMHIIQTTTDANFKEKILEMKDPSFKEVIELARKMEISENSTQAALNSGTFNCNKSTNKFNPRKSSNGEKCKSCGKTNHKRSECRFKDAECHYCKIKGHIKSVCGKRLREDIGKSNESEKDIKTTKVIKIKGVGSPKDRIEITVANDKTQFNFYAFPDSGADTSLISSDLIKSHGIKYDKSKKPIVINASCKRMNVIGTTKLNVKYGSISTQINIIVTTDMKDEILIDRETLKVLHVLHKDYPKQMVIRRMTSSEWFSKYPDVFEDSDNLKSMNASPMKIHLKEDIEIKPTRIITPRRIPVNFEDRAKEEIERCLNAGIIEHVTEPTDWTSPAFFREKKGTDKLRLVVDYTGLNQQVKRPVHPFPSVSDIQKKIPSNSKFFCKLDARKGYWQVKLCEESRDLTTFITPYGRHRFCRAPMGLRSSNDEFCIRTDRAIEGIAGVIKIIDDILISTESEKQLEERIDQVLQACSKAGITLSRSKFEISNKVKFSGLSRRRKVKSHI